MLSHAMVVPTIPVSDMARAKKFYEETLGLEPDDAGTDYGARYECGDSTAIFVYPSAGAGTSQGTCASWTVEDLDSEMEELRDRGVKFEEYDMPGLKTVDGVATNGDMRSAWFKDPDGNILALNEQP